MEFNKARVSLHLAFVLLAGILLSGLSAAMPATTDIVVAKSHDSDDDSGVSTDALPRFNSVSQAVAYIESHEPQKDKVWTVFINEGMYRERVVINVDNVHLIGQSQETTTIVFNRYAGQKVAENSDEKWGTRRTATVEILGDNITLENITITNDFDYPGNEVKAKNDPTRLSGTQAVALKTDVNSDRTYLKNVALWGYQDTLYLKGDRALVEGGTIAGHIDFIFGEGTAFFEGVSIVSRTRYSGGDSEGLTGYITAPSTHLQRPYGLTFNNCRLERENGVPDESVALGRPWHPTTTFSDGRYANPYAVGKSTFINTYMDSHIANFRWAPMKGKTADGVTRLFSPHTEARFAEYGSYGPGTPQPADLPDYSSHFLSAPSASFYRKSYILKGWDPVTD
ncbi:pectin esterase [Alteromonas sp. V450]|uniref:pectinesterase family protein n=1 Tax=Alteromonas sp. V450 TaxID=1912139 RepID=UPI0008FF44DE|nr:pectinesterase family protein [Alteromonas sp. V450]OJF68466.1 pectin esterase [Alteromonas sp. V450]